MDIGKYRKILVAIDGSESSKHALRESFKLATDEKCWVTVVSVIPRYEGDIGAMWINNVKEAMEKPCRIALSEAENMAKKERVLIKTVCEEGEIYERIVALADAESCDVIVMGRKGMSLFGRTLIGSVTARVIGYSQKDVLVVPEGSPVGWKTILLATDGSKYSVAATNRAIDCAKSYGGDLCVLAVIDIPPEFYSHVKALDTADDLLKNAKDIVDKAKKQAETQGIKTETYTKEGEPSKVITDLARGKACDVIVIGSHGRTGLRRLLMGSVAEKVIGHSPCPVLVTTA
jgi:nucleotide-binding universal stress UspA family protein